MTDRSPDTGLALLPCPFCGGEAKLETGQHNFDDAQVSCLKCGMCGPDFDNDSAIGPAIDDPEAEAEAHWNTRKPGPPQSPGLREALDMCVDVLKHVQKTYSVPDSPIINMALERAAKALAAQSPVLPPSGVLEKIDNLLDAVWNADERKDEVQALVAVKNYVRAALSASVAGEARRKKQRGGKSERTAGTHPMKQLGRTFE